MNGNDLLEYIICSTYDEQILKRPEIISAISYRKFPKFCNFANRLLLLWREVTKTEIGIILERILKQRECEAFGRERM